MTDEMRRTRNGFVTALLLFGIAYVVISNTDLFSSSTALPAELDNVAEMSAPTERVWLDVDPTALSRVEIDSVLVGPRDVLYTNGSLIVSDHPVRILRFDTSGTYLNRYGNGQGFAPGEMSDYSDVLLHDSTVVVLVSNGRSIHTYSLEGSLAGQTDLNFLPIYGISWADSLLISTMTMGRATPFQVLSKGGALGSAFGWEVAELGSAMEITGKMAQNDRGGFYYVFRYISMLLEYDSDGTLIHRIELPDRQTLKTQDGTKDSDGNMTFRAPNPPVRYTDIEYSDGLVLISGYDISPSNKLSFVDIYSEDPWTYVGSIQMTGPVRGFATHGSTLYAAMDTSIYQLELPSLPND